MAISDAQFLAWLRTSTERMVLVEADVWSGGGVVTRYMSNRGWVSAPTDTPASTAYDDIVLDVPGIRAQMADALQGRSVVSFGDIEIGNWSGERDSWLTDAWDGRPLRIYLGDASWAKSDFRLVFNGATADIQAHGTSRLTLRLRDRQIVLDRPMLSAVVGGTGSTAGQRIPCCYGQVYNAEPLMVDATARRYQVHDGQIQAITAVRSNGEVVNPANYTVDLATGTFVTAFSIPGTITCDVQGSATGGLYINRVGDIFGRILTERGLLTAGDIDGSAVVNLNHDSPGVVGLYVRDDSTTVLDALDALITGVGGYYAVARDGTFTGGLFAAATGSPLMTITDDDLVVGGVELSRRIIPLKSVRLGYDRNWAPGGTISTNVTDEATRARLRDEYRIASAVTSGSAQYLLATDSDVIPTVFVSATDATTEATRRAGLYGVLRRVFTLRATLAAQPLRLGNVVALDLSRFGLAGGVLARVIGLRESITTDSVEVEVWV